jgi:hypothetical protein
MGSDDASLGGQPESPRTGAVLPPCLATTSPSACGTGATGCNSPAFGLPLENVKIGDTTDSVEARVSCAGAVQKRHRSNSWQPAHRHTMGRSHAAPP